MQYLILYLILFAICLYKFKIVDNPNGQVDILLIQKNVNMLRGIFAIFIIYTHCTLALQQLPVMLIPLRKVSTFGVGFFFALSGYGLALSTHLKDNYLDDFLQRKIPPILITAIISRVVSELIMIIYMGGSFSTLKIITQMNWYIYVMIILYILFYLDYKLVANNRHRVFGIWALVIAFTIIVLMLVHMHVPFIGRSYYISEWAFPLGVTIYEYRNIINKLLSKYRYIMFVCMVMFLATSFWLALKAEELGLMDLLSHNLMLIPFFYFVILCCKYVKFDNPLLCFLNKNSFEIYLYQFVVINILTYKFKNYNTMFFLACVALTVVLAVIVRGVCSGLSNIFGRVVRNRSNVI